MPKLIFDLLAPIYDRLITGKIDKILLDILIQSKSKNVLEIGAGTGRTAQDVLKYCDNVWLLDPSEKMLKKARQKLKDVTITHGFVEKLPYKEKMFDLVYAIDSLHHWDDQIKGIEEIYRVLKPGGKFVLIDFDPTKRIGHYIKAMERALFMGSTFFSLEGVKRIISDVNFEIEDSKFIDEGTYIAISRK